MDGGMSGRLEGLAGEIKKLHKENQELVIQNNILRGTIHARETHASELKTSLEALSKDNALLKERMVLLEKKYKGKMKKMQADARRNDVFREVYKGTSKTKREELVNEKIRALENTNNTLLGFVREVASRFGFDADTCAALCEVATGTNDCLIRMFLESIQAPSQRDADAPRKTDGKNLLLGNMDEFEKQVLGE